MSTPATTTALRSQIPLIVLLGVPLETDAYTIVSATQNQELGSGDALIDVVELSFYPNAHQSVFTLDVPITQLDSGSIDSMIRAKVAVIEAIYAL